MISIRITDTAMQLDRLASDQQAGFAAPCLGGAGFCRATGRVVGLVETGACLRHNIPRQFLLHPQVDKAMLYGLELADRSAELFALFDIRQRVIQGLLHHADQFSRRA